MIASVQRTGRAARARAFNAVTCFRELTGESHYMLSRRERKRKRENAIRDLSPKHRMNYVNIAGTLSRASFYFRKDFVIIANPFISLFLPSVYHKYNVNLIA